MTTPVTQEGTAEATPEVAAPDMTHVTIQGQPVEATEGEVLLAGKFKTQEDLIKAYSELETKLGVKSQQPAEPPVTEEEPAEVAPAAETPEGDVEDASPYGPAVSNALKAADLNLDDVRKEYTANAGKLSDASYEALEKAGFPKAMTDTYLKGLENAATNQNAVTEAQIIKIKASVGGDAQFTTIQDHVSNSWSDAEKAAYNAEINSGDMPRVQNAVKVAQASYLKDIGTEAHLDAGGRAPSAEGGYASADAMMEDMRKPEYKTSQTFRDKVAAKLMKSPNVVQTR